jgi:SAM-dependent methyltransferase
MKEIKKIKHFIEHTIRVLKRKKMNRNTMAVTEEYTASWNLYRDKLDKSNTVEEWLNENDGVERYYNIEGKFSKQNFDHADFYRKTFLNAFNEYFPNAKIVAEFGCGVGRNLIYLHKHHPELELYGFELCAPGVELANKAAQKFNLPIKYYQLDYLNWIPSDIKMPAIDVGFTIFSLEQIPEQVQNLKALNNILEKVKLGTFHLEPVVENYPKTIKGMVARIDHKKIGYLTDFEKSAKLAVGEKNIIKKVYNSAHNPLMWPSIYVLKKNKI